MNDFSVMERNKDRERRRTLLIIEGSQGEYELFSLLLDGFPKITIKESDIWVYGTDIYDLHKDLEDYYGKDWATNKEIDVDLPFLLSKKMKMKKKVRKSEFANIILVFDYERQDPYFSEEAILNMQRVFNDPTDKGKLYINYPMVESYKHFKCLPDPGYYDRTMDIDYTKGNVYKNKVKKESAIQKYFDFPKKMDKALKDRYEVEDILERSNIWNRYLQSFRI